MKKFMQTVGVCSFLSLGSCTPDIATIQKATVQICGFVPTAVVIASLFPNPYTIPAGAIAQAICDAVATQVPLQARRRLRTTQQQTGVRVNVGGQNLIVNGYFVR